MILMDTIQSGLKRFGSRISAKSSSSSLSSSSVSATATVAHQVTTSTSTTITTLRSSMEQQQRADENKKQATNMRVENPNVPHNPSPSSSSPTTLSSSSTTTIDHSVLDNHQHHSQTKVEQPLPLKKQSHIAPCEVEALAKRKNIHTPLNVVTATACCPKKPNKSRETRGRRDCGEDAVFVCRNFPSSTQQQDCSPTTAIVSTTSNNEVKGPSKKSSSPVTTTTGDMDRVCCIGVADGVGSYVLRGIDPSVFAWAIMEGTKQVFETERSVSCLQALTKSYDKICKEGLVQAGGSTACVVSMHHGTHSETGMPVLKLTAATLGDSCFLVIRNGKIIYRSEEQLHGYNCPYQLSVPRDESNPKQDDPSKSIVLDEPLDLMRDDIVIVSTDGLTDNVFDEEVARILSQIKESSTKETAAKMASELLKTAYVNSRSKDSYTPFTKYAMEHNQKYIPHGKVDDITFVVALVS